MAFHFWVTVTLTSDLVFSEKRFRSKSHNFEVGIPNWCVDASWDGSVVYNFCITVTLT